MRIATVMHSVIRESSWKTITQINQETSWLCNATTNVSTSGRWMNTARPTWPPVAKQRHAVSHEPKTHHATYILKPCWLTHLHTQYQQFSLTCIEQFRHLDCAKCYSRFLLLLIFQIHYWLEIFSGICRVIVGKLSREYNAIHSCLIMQWKENYLQHK